MSKREDFRRDVRSADVVYVYRCCACAALLFASACIIHTHLYLYHLNYNRAGTSTAIADACTANLSCHLACVSERVSGAGGGRVGEPGVEGMSGRW